MTQGEGLNRVIRVLKRPKQEVGNAVLSARSWGDAKKRPESREAAASRGGRRPASRYRPGV